MAEQEKKGTFWKSFVSLNWYDSAIEFLFRFVAKTSEPLLAAGIVYSAADVLSKGHLGSANPTMDNLWAISQALAIESSGGVVLVYGLQSLKEKDHVKAWLYFILSALLASTGGIMLFMQLAGWENQQPDSSFMLFLFGLRCVVSVGYIYLCRTKSISFRNLDKATAPAPSQEPAPSPIDYQKLAQELAPLLQAVRTTIIEEVKASITTAAPPAHSMISSTNPNQEAAPSLFLDAPHQEKAPATRATNGKSSRKHQRRASAQDGSTNITQEERLEHTYQEMLKESPGKYISGRALSERARIHRTTCTRWLRANHPENEAMNASTSDNEISAMPRVQQQEAEPASFRSASTTEPALLQSDGNEQDATPNEIAGYSIQERGLAPE